MAVHLTGHRGGFGPGLTEVTRSGDPEDDTGIGFAILRLGAGERIDETCDQETAWLLLDGRVTVNVDGQATQCSRQSLFDALPSCLHVSRGQAVQISCDSAVELAVFRCTNDSRFAATLYTPDRVRDEARGRGQVRDAALRWVRTVFDGSNADAAAQLVVGEVLTLPGRWSSYPPHHHPQPEIYHYRFTEAQGYGHAELGEQVLKVRHNDTVKILAGLDHAQVAAPGYGMYYIWVIRHLPGQRYDVPEFTAEHTWTMQTDAAVWWPRALADDDG